MTRLVLVQRLFACSAVWLVTLTGHVGAQDHTEYEPADIAYGLTLYRSQCATCHGSKWVRGLGLEVGEALIFPIMWETERRW